MVFKVLRTLLFFISLVTACLLYWCLLLLIWRWVSPYQRYRICNTLPKWIRFSLRLLCDVRISVDGAPHIQQTPSIILVRHESALETLVLSTIFPNAVFVLKKELLSIPWISVILKAHQAVPIDRAKGTSAMRYMLGQVADRLKNGFSVVIFPEGTRTLHQQPGTIKRGGCVAASANAVPTYFVSHNAGQMLAPKDWIIKPGVITFSINAPQALYQKPINQITQQLNEFFKMHITAP